MITKFPLVFKILDYQNLFEIESKINHPNGLKKNKQTVLNRKNVIVRVSLGRNTLEEPKKNISETIKKDFEVVKSFLISNKLLTIKI